jgi:23S rRNA (guanosine2251-2'-O)-methyltransferase
VASVSSPASTIDELKEEGFWVVGASEHAEQTIWEAPIDGRIALVMGSEGSGISRLVLEHCDILATLPQAGVVESLNVAQATTVFCYEWLRRTSADA